jgi:hypothetical protein
MSAIHNVNHRGLCAKSSPLSGPICYSGRWECGSSQSISITKKDTVLCGSKLKTNGSSTSFAAGFPVTRDVKNLEGHGKRLAIGALG